MGQHSQCEAFQNKLTFSKACQFCDNLKVQNEMGGADIPHQCNHGWLAAFNLSFLFLSNFENLIKICRKLFSTTTG